MYQALYRKWRPKTFEDVVGQEHITDTLRRQAAQGRLSHAYLFTGTRGTGKTTCAKILAKAVNCQNPSDGDPCGQCPACLGIDNGSLLDVMELDAASNNGVDHVRALRDEAIYSPASVKYRVYIIDEVHMLSVAAFNALLKILEEPPAHLIFILATTELHKVPATILSRCQRFAFKRIMPQDIAQRLLYVSAQENIALSPDAAETLARLADGALRDALSLLDQCAAAGGTIDGPRVLDVLGLAGAVQTAQMMDLLLRRDVPGALMLLHQLYTGGKDVAALLGELSTLARDLLIRMTAPAGGAALLSGNYDSGTLESLAQSANATRLIYMATQLQSALADNLACANAFIQILNTFQYRIDVRNIRRFHVIIQICFHFLYPLAVAVEQRHQGLTGSLYHGVKFLTADFRGIFFKFLNDIADLVEDTAITKGIVTCIFYFVQNIAQVVQNIQLNALLRKMRNFVTVA